MTRHLLPSLSAGAAELLVEACCRTCLSLRAFRRQGSLADTLRRHEWGQDLNGDWHCAPCFEKLPEEDL